MRFFAAAIIFFGVAASYAQTPEVPRKMQFAGMTLTIHDDARQEIQKDVDALTQHSRYYLLKVERAKTYFPIIEKIFEEELVPEDFKYLVLQESALVPDAVSVSNAVGFWQFKDFTAVEMGLRVDKDIDERMNLVSATRGAARYLKQNNFYFNNWLLALQSYQMGAGGVKRAVGDGQNGARKMEITSDTYWYVKKFLAHKVAFEPATHGEGQVKIVSYQTKRPQSLKEIASAVSSDESVLKEYNKWLKTDVIPTDKPYTVLIPVGKLDGDFNKLVLSSSKASKAMPLVASVEKENEKVNGIPVIRAKSGETITTLATRAGISLSAFLKYNDMAIDQVLEPGSTYLLGKKRNGADKPYHKVKPGDDLWSISQRYGVRIRKLLKYNRLHPGDLPEMGTVVWLNSMKPKEGSGEVTETEVAQLDENEVFDWYTKTMRTTETIPVVKEQAEMDSRPDSIQEDRVSDPVASAPVSRNHIVKPGDTYYSIAKQYGVQVTDLLARNNLTIQNTLNTGQVLKITDEDSTLVNNRSGKDVEPGGQTIVHQVKSSDTLYSIARQFGVTINDLLEWNNKKDLTLTVGEKLTIIRK